MSKARIQKCQCEDSYCSADGRAIVVDSSPLTAEEVEKALEYIRHGWIQGTVQMGDKVCSIGALNRARYGAAQVAMFNNDDVMIQHNAALKEFVQLSEIKNSHLHHWNDGHNRTQEEVEDKFMLVAKKLRDQGR